MDANGNGISITKSQISFWATALVGAVSVIGTYFGASRPSQPQTSTDNQQQILSNQAFVMGQAAKIDDMLKNQKLILDKLADMDSKKK